MKIAIILALCLIAFAAVKSSHAKESSIKPLLAREQKYAMKKVKRKSLNKKMRKVKRKSLNKKIKERNEKKKDCMTECEKKASKKIDCTQWEQYWSIENCKTNNRKKAEKTRKCKENCKILSYKEICKEMISGYDHDYV